MRGVAPFRTMDRLANPARVRDALTRTVPSATFVLAIKPSHPGRGIRVVHLVSLWIEHRIHAERLIVIPIVHRRANVGVDEIEVVALSVTLQRRRGHAVWERARKGRPNSEMSSCVPRNSAAIAAHAKPRSTRFHAARSAQHTSR